MAAQRPDIATTELSEPRWLRGWLEPVHQALLPMRATDLGSAAIGTILHHERERLLTFLYRVYTLLFACLVVALLPLAGTNIPTWRLGYYLIVFITAWYFALNHQAGYRLRLVAYFAIAYTASLAWLAQFGLTGISIVQLYSLTIVAIVLTGLSGGLRVFALSVGTLIAAVWLIPLSAATPLAAPDSMTTAVLYIVIFIEEAIITLGTLYFILRRLTRNWAQAQRRLARTEQALEQMQMRVAERTQELAAAWDRALETSKFKSELLARVSHELRTPLGTILGYGELLQSGAFGELNTEQVEAAGLVTESAYHLTNLVNDILDQMRLENDQLTLINQKFEVRELLDAAEIKLKPLADRKGLTLAIEVAADMPQTLVGDAGRLGQILLNLAGNALKFTQQGGVTIRLAPQGNEGWEMAVQDTGPGIAEQLHELVFEPFWQGDQSLTRIHGGTGLGLAIARQLAERMGGRISVESAEGAGATFRVCLPLVVT